MIDIEIPIGRRTAYYRFFEMLPAFLTYGLILLAIVLSLVSPLWAAIFILGYDAMWFGKAIGMAFRTIQGYRTLQMARRVDWRRRLGDLQNPTEALKQRLSVRKSTEWRRVLHYRNLQRIAANPDMYCKPDEIYNAVIVPFYTEGRDTLEPTVRAVVESDFSAKRVILLLAYEERGGEAAQQLADSLIAEYGARFYYAAAVMHPKNIKNEIIGKGGNITFAGRYLEKLLKEHKIDPDKVIVTSLDADNHPHPAYFAYVTYEYIIDLDHRHRAFQPIALFTNNIWDAPAPMRVIATGNSFWNIINSLRPHMLRNFSAHSQGMSSLIETDFWSVRTIVEDGHQYWRSYFRFDGEYEVIPIYVPIYQDAVLAGTYAKTVRAQFIQLRRWAYGASDVAYVADKGFRAHKGQRKLPLMPLLARFLRLLEGHVSWATSPIIITFGAWAPLFFNTEARRSIVAHELPQIASQMQFVAMIGLFLTVFLSMKTLPPRPARYRRHRNLFMIAQWTMMPITSIGFGSAAAITSQTRLLIGKYLDKFDLTTKAVKK